jgi:hypothetical protein
MTGTGDDDRMDDGDDGGSGDIIARAKGVHHVVLSVH